MESWKGALLSDDIKVTRFESESGRWVRDKEKGRCVVQRTRIGVKLAGVCKNAQGKYRYLVGKRTVYDWKSQYLIIRCIYSCKHITDPHLHAPF